MDEGKDPSDIRGWQRLSSEITTSGKLDEGDPARLASIGVRHVINLALDDHAEALADEGEKLAGLGIDYTHIPVPFDAPTQGHYETFRDAVTNLDGPVHVHCIMNWRVSAFFYLLHLEQGMAEAQARTMMQRQWDPITSSHPAAAPWKALMEKASLG